MTVSMSHVRAVITKETKSSNVAQCCSASKCRSVLLHACHFTFVFSLREPTLTDSRVHSEVIEAEGPHPALDSSCVFIVLNQKHVL